MLKSLNILIVCLFLFLAASSANAGVISRAPNNLGLVGYWSFNDATSTTRSTLVQDFSGNNNNGVMTNMANPATAVSGVADGRLGKALSFDGSDDYVRVLTSSSLNFAGKVSLSAWIYPRISNAYQAIVVKASGVDQRQYAYYLSINGTSQIFIALGTSNLGNVVVSPEWSVNQWNHIVLTADGSNVKIYINGVLANTTAGAYVSSVAAVDIGIGVDIPYGTFFTKGLIDEVRIYNRALSADEVRSLYNSR